MEGDDPQSTTFNAPLLRSKFAEAANEFGHQQSRGSRNKKKKDMLLKGLINTTNTDSSLRLTAMGAHQNRSDGDTNLSSRGTNEDSPSETNTNNKVQESEGGSTAAPSNSKVKHSKKLDKIKSRQCIDRRTAGRWMSALGFEYSEQGKCYYVDAHERADVIRYRHKFVYRYMDEYEPYTPRWVQIELEKLKETLEGEKIVMDVSDFKSNDTVLKEVDMYDAILRRGRTYKDENNNEKIELHVDAIADDCFSILHPFVAAAEERNNGIGANQSVFRKDKKRKVLLTFGQDECIFKQFLLHRKAWQSKDGRFRVRPKDDGSGVMVSAFQSRAFGFGFPDFDKFKNEINMHRQGKKYTDETAAKKINQCAEKKNLTEDPFVRLFEYGNSDGKEGYWSYDHMVLQFEDVMDVLFVVFQDKYDFLFLFDHSCGHDRMRPDALNVNSMNVGFGGTSAKVMHDSKIEEVDGYLGPFLYPHRSNEQLQVGDIAKMVFSENDVGPFWMKQKEREERRWDKIVGKHKPRPKNRNELRKEILAKDPDANLRGGAAQLQQRARTLGITVEKVEDKVREGWVGKPKGMRQVAFERGFIDLENLKFYSKDGPMDENNKVIDESFSLKSIVSSLTDFVEEMTLLQHMATLIGEKMGLNITIDRTPKCHPEVAGEGVEYTWANSKIYLRGVPIGKRRSVKQFLEQVRLALDREKGAALTKLKIRKFAARARDFIAAYQFLDDETNSSSASSTTVNTLSMHDIEHVRKRYRSHRGVDRAGLSWCAAAAIKSDSAVAVENECEKDFV